MLTVWNFNNTIRPVEYFHRVICVATCPLIEGTLDTIIGKFFFDFMYGFQKLGIGGLPRACAPKLYSRITVNPAGV